MRVLFRRLGQAVVGLTVIFTLVGCGGVATAPPASPAATYYAADGRLDIINNANEAIYYFYLSSCSSDSWGSDQLDSSEVISVGSTYTFTITAGCWDLKAEMASGAETETYGVQISANDPKVWTIGNESKK